MNACSMQVGRTCYNGSDRRRGFSRFLCIPSKSRGRIAGNERDCSLPSSASEPRRMEEAGNLTKLCLGADQPIQPTQCRIGTHLAIWAVPGMSGEPSKRVRDLGALTLAAREPQLPQAANDGRVSLATALPTEEMTRTAVHCMRDLYWKAVSVKD